MGTQKVEDVTPYPTPADQDSILVDTREGSPQSVQGAGIGTLEQANSVSGMATFGAEDFAFTSDFDGAQTAAWVARYEAVDGNYGDRRAFLQTEIEPSREVYIQWKQWMGRRPDDGVGWGELRSFDFTNHTDPVGNASRKNIRVVGSDWSGGNALWTGSMPGPEPVGLQFFDEQSFNVLRSAGEWSTRADELANSHLVFTYRIKAESSPEATDGALEVWLVKDGRVVYHDLSEGLNMRSRDVRQINIGLMMRSPIEDMSEYFWDVLIWTEGEE